MLFNSISYAIFLPVVFCIYWGLPHRFRWVLLLIASYYFYMSWNPEYVLLILFTTVVSYFTAIVLEEMKEHRTREWALFIALVLCLGILMYFKYFNFLSRTFFDILSAITIKLNPVVVDILLPVGISFYTFQTLSYVIDVYRGKVKAERHFGYYATFISFFPQSVAGPIERTENLMPQIRKEHIFNYEQATYGLKLIAWGFFKKLAIADNLFRYVQMVYDTPFDYRGFALVLASVFFAIQIYCDFSGYSDIAVGTAKLFGINLMTNFRSPYLSSSVKEFWTRWHISLSTWFRDYVYIPLGGNRVCKIRQNLNMLVTFLVSGLWHGADWTFVVWGGVHGLVQILEKNLIGRKRWRSSGTIQILRVILVFIFAVFAWVFFVSKTLPEAFYVISHMFDGIGNPMLYLKDGFRSIHFGKSDIVIHMFMVTILLMYDYVSLKRDVINLISRKNLVFRWTVYVVFVLIIAFFSQKGVAAEFVYFQF